MSLRGSGALGLRSGLVPLKTLLDERQTERTIIARCGPQRVVPTTWELVSGDLYRAPWIFWIDGTPCEVQSCSSRSYPFDGIPRSATLADIASPGFFYDLATNTQEAPAQWDDPEDTGGYDGAPWLYVDLGGDDPAEEALAVAVDVPFASRHADLPLTLANVTTDGNFEDGLGSWAKTAAAGTVVVTGVPGYADAASLLITALTGAANGTLIAYVLGGHSSAGITFVPAEVGQQWIISGFYLNAHPDLPAVLRVYYGANQYAEDGRHTTTATAGHQLGDSHGDWRYFEFVIRAKATTGHAVKLGASKLADLESKKVVRFDAVQVRPLVRYVRAHGRLTGSVTLESGSSELVFGGKSVGVSGLETINADGALDFAYRSLSWPGAAVRLEESARARSDRTQALRRMIARQLSVTASTDRVRQDVSTALALPVDARQSEYRTFSAGWVEAADRDGDVFGLEVEELRTMLASKRAAPSKYLATDSGEPDERILGKIRPLVIGTVQSLEPARVDRTAAENGVYEVADPTLWPAGIFALDRVVLYADSDAASRRDEGQSLDLLTVSGVITQDLAGCGFEANTPIKPFLLGVENEYLSIVADAATYDLRLMSGTESLELLTADADGSDVDLIVSGAPTEWQAVVDQGNGRIRTASSVAMNSWMSVSVTAPPTATSIAHVEIQAIIEGAGNEPQWNDTAVLYAKKISTGDRYNSTGVTNETGLPSTGVFWRNPGAPFLAKWRMDVDPSDSAPWTAAKIAGYEFGVRYRTGNVSGYLFVDMIRVEARLFLATPPSASQPGLCIPLTLAQRIQAECDRQAGAGRILVTLDAANKIKFDATTPGILATLDLLTSTGKQKSAWGWIGFATDNDHTGSLTYTAEEPIYTADADIDKPIIRVDLQGYKDDADGTYTGHAGALIVLAPDVLRFLCVVWFKLPAALIDVDSFEAARATVTQEPIAMLIKEEREVRDIFDSIERSSFSDVVFVPDAYRVTELPMRLQFRAFTLGAAGVTVELSRDDFLALKDRSKRSSTAAKVEASYGKSMAIQGTRETVSADVPHIKHQTDTKSVETDFRDPSGAQAVTDFLAPLLADPRLIEAECVKGGLTLLAAGDKILVSYSRLIREFPGVLHIDPTTGIPGLPPIRELDVYERVPFRLIRASHSKDTGVSRILALKIEEP